MGEGWGIGEGLYQSVAVVACPSDGQRSQSADSAQTLLVRHVPRGGKFSGNDNKSIR